MSAKISMMLGMLPQFKNFSKCEVDGTPSNEQEFLASVRLYKRHANPAEPSILVPSSEWGFSYADVMAQESALKAIAMEQVREKRNKLLTEADSVTMKCLSMGLTIPAEWSAYQQALRDLPTTSDPDFGPDSNIVGVNWPVAPSTKP